MAWNPEPEIAALRDMAKKFNYDQVVALGFNYSKEQIQALSYGRTRNLCDMGAELAKACMETVNGFHVKPTVQWVPVGEKLPDDDMTVLFALECGEVWTGFMDEGQWR
ncbi:MAG: hypothetical protein WCS94_14155 [Verrucomicrobiota bacterium]